MSTLAGECGKAGAEDGPAAEARFSTGITSAWCTPEGPIAVSDASSSSVRWVAAGGSFPITPAPRPQPEPHPQPGPPKPSDHATGEARMIFEWMTSSTSHWTRGKFCGFIVDWKPILTYATFGCKTSAGCF